MLSQTIPTQGTGAYSYLIVQPPSDPYTTKLTNLWYSWANYYTQQFTGPNPDQVNATVSADTDSPSDTRILTLPTDSQLAVGMTVATGNGVAPANLTTILKIVTSGSQEQLYLECARAHSGRSKRPIHIPQSPGDQVQQ